MLKVKLTQDPYSNGGSVCFGVYALDGWYEASCITEDGDEGTVYWKIKNHDADDESYACDWNKPYAAYIYDEDNSETVLYDGGELKIID